MLDTFTYCHQKIVHYFQVHPNSLEQLRKQAKGSVLQLNQRKARKSPRLHRGLFLVSTFQAENISP